LLKSTIDTTRLRRDTSLRSVQQIPTASCEVWFCAEGRFHGIKMMGEPWKQSEWQQMDALTLVRSCMAQRGELPKLLGTIG
jgi:hypothetical protein